ncbi:hypothetical protein V8G54_013274, partial [Vigna mungo]
MDVAITVVCSPAIVLGRPISASASARLSSTPSFPESFASLHFLSPSNVVEEITSSLSSSKSEEPSASGTDFDFVQMAAKHSDVLLWRIAEVKANNERRKALEEILYAL